MEPYYEIDFAELSQMTGTADMTGLSDDFLISRISGSDAYPLLRYPARLNAYAAIYCTRGQFDVDINVRTFRVNEDMMLFYVPGSTVRIKESEADRLKASEAILVAASKEFLQGVQVNFNGLFERSIKLMNNPCITIDKEGHKILSDYYALVSDLYSFRPDGAGDAIRSIGTSLMCLLGNLWNRELSKPAVIEQGRTRQNRAQSHMEEFLSLVAENFMTEKNVSFYAEKLCMTPKYLTTLVKNASGRTATDWIDAFLVLEAKNLLKYSDLTVKEIGYRLHFQSIPSFHKFFKNQTGMTPMEYRTSR